MKQLLILVTLILSWPQITYAQQSCALTPESCTVLMMVGDSITYGIPIIPRSFRNPDDGLGDNFGPSVLDLQNRLNESLRPTLAVNWGLGGSSSLNGVERIGGIISNSVSRYPATKYFTLIQYGTNDQNYGFSTSTTKANIGVMIDASRARGVTPVVSNLPPRSDQDVSVRNQKIAEIANEKSVPFVNHFSTMTATSRFFVFENGAYLHPNELGYAVLGINWFNQAMAALIAPVPLPEPDPEPVIAPILGLLLEDDE